MRFLRFAFACLIFSISHHVLADEDCFEFRGKEDEVATLIGHPGHEVKVMKGRSWPMILTVIYNPDIDPRTFRATLDGKDVTKLFIRQDGKLSETVALPGVQDHQSLRVTAHYKTDYSDPAWETCDSPPLHWRQWAFVETSLRVISGATFSTQSSADMRGVAVEPQGNSFRLKPIGEFKPIDEKQAE